MDMREKTMRKTWKWMMRTTSNKSLMTFKPSIMLSKRKHRRMRSKRMKLWMTNMGMRTMMLNMEMKKRVKMKMMMDMEMRSMTEKSMKKSLRRFRFISVVILT
jgi:hypothetical protein